MRLISATNADVNAEVAAGRFRQDLLFRLNTIEIRLPALRERRDDIPRIAKHFLGAHAQRYRKAMTGFDPAALQRYCKEKCGVVLGTGIGDLSGQAFRIAHMGHVNAPMILGTLGVVEVGLNALNIPHGKGGTEAAIEYLGENVAA